MIEYVVDMRPVRVWEMTVDFLCATKFLLWAVAYFVQSIVVDMVRLIGVFVGRIMRFLGKLFRNLRDREFRKRIELFNIVLLIALTVQLVVSRQMLSGVSFLVAATPLIFRGYFINAIRSGKIKTSMAEYVKATEIASKMQVVLLAGLIIGVSAASLKPNEDTGYVIGSFIVVAEWTLFVELFYTYFHLMGRGSVNRAGEMPQQYVRTVRRIPRSARFSGAPSRKKTRSYVAGHQRYIK